ncbi:hypothetical protein CCACVL1_19609 [Corchorus capsularis]|uniref:TF-B3 domain-containing protein n=1 Tax=Corchorus capsularis TaxID=210143 RepID=A0A1R3HFP2_COCAP|nr:hypothetical protein CCACVL1_19609 [Corchorus capsularis]
MAIFSKILSQTDVTIFSKILSQTDVTRRCSVPMKYFKLRSFPKSPFVVEDDSGCLWRLCCYIRSKNHPKPALVSGWVPFVKSMKLRVGDRVLIYAEQDETGSTRYKIKVQKQTFPSKVRGSHTRKNHDRMKVSPSQSDNGSTQTTIQPSGYPFPCVLNHGHGRTTAMTSSHTNKEQTPTKHSTSQGISCHKTEGPSPSLSLESTQKATMTGRTAAATSSSTDKKHMTTPHSSRRNMALYKTEIPSPNLSLELSLKPTLTECQQHAYMQKTIPKTIDFLAGFS